MPRYLHSLDILRGLSSLGVVLFHWSNFFCWDPAYEVDRLPFYHLFRLFYVEGFRMVDLFFVISGFVFFWLYSAQIKAERISAFRFTVYRLSRLYPLHFLTLIAVVVIQQISFSSFGEFFVYQDNSVFQFFLHLFMAFGVGFSVQFSFNGPAWSVCVEFLMYSIFFMACRLGMVRWWHLLFLVGCGMLLVLIQPMEFVGRGMIGFFNGGLTFYLFRRIHHWEIPMGWVITAFLLLLGLWFLFPHYHQIFEVYSESGLLESLGPSGQASAKRFLVNILPSLLSNFLLAPLTILVLCFIENGERVGAHLEKFTFLGKISYSSYLLHFPLQAIITILCRKFSVPSEVFYSPASVIFFFSLLIPLSYVVNRHIERPCQTFLRNSFIKTPA